jgi:hypothetical protein
VEHRSHFILFGDPTIGQPSHPVYDAVSDELIVFGGRSTGPCCSNHQRCVGREERREHRGSPYWQQLYPSGDPNSNPAFPMGRIGHSAFGGGQPNSYAFGVLFNDVWVLQNDNGGGAPQWQQLYPSGPAPAVREESSGNLRCLSKSNDHFRRRK